MTTPKLTFLYTEAVWKKSYSIVNFHKVSNARHMFHFGNEHVLKRIQAETNTLNFFSLQKSKFSLEHIFFLFASLFHLLLKFSARDDPSLQFPRTQMVGTSSHTVQNKWTSGDFDVLPHRVGL